MRIVVVIRGGVLQEVLCDEDADVTLIDFDDEEEGSAAAEKQLADLEKEMVSCF